jgi:hypothetical protein
MLLWKVEELLRERGIPVVHELTGDVGGWLKIEVPQALITIEPRPLYCDRGNFIVKVFPRGDLALSLDEQDRFPRYYFGVLACVTELYAWMQVRGILPEGATDAPPMRPPDVPEQLRGRVVDPDPEHFVVDVGYDDPDPRYRREY